MFSCEFANSFFIEHLWTTREKAVYTTEKTVLLFRRISQIDRKIPVIESFILTLQAKRPTILLKKTSSNMFSRKFDEVFQKIFSQSTSHNPLLQILANLLNTWAIIFAYHSRYFEAQCLCFHQDFVTTLLSLFQSLLAVV